MWQGRCETEAQTSGLKKSFPNEKATKLSNERWFYYIFRIRDEWVTVTNFLNCFCFLPIRLK